VQYCAELLFIMSSEWTS